MPMVFNPLTCDLDFTTDLNQMVGMYLGVPANRTALFEMLFLAGSGSSTILTSLGAMDSAYLGQPFVDGPHQGSTTMTGMDYAYMGQPFVRGVK